MTKPWLRLVAGLLGALLIAGAVATRPWSSDPASLLAKGAQGQSRWGESLAATGLTVRVLGSTPLALRNDPGFHAGSTLLVVPGASRAYTAEEARFVADAVRHGARALVMEDSGRAGTLTAPLGLSFERAPLVGTEGTGDTNLWFSTGSSNHTLSARLPTPLLVSPGAAVEVVARTTALTVVDRDNDATFARQDPGGSFPLAVRLVVGSGEVWAVGSLDLFSDRQADDPAVKAWRQDLLDRIATPGTTIIVDESHHPQFGLAQAGAAVVRATSATPDRWGLLAAAAMGALALGGTGTALVQWGRHRHDPLRYRGRSELSAVTVRLAADDAALPTYTAWSRRAGVAVAAALLLLGLGTALRSAPAMAAGVLLVLLLAAAIVRREPRVQVERTLSHERAPEDQDVHVQLKVGADRRVAVELRECLPVEDDVVAGSTWHRLILAPRRPADLSYTLRAALRGPHSIGPLRVRTGDPLGLRVRDGVVEGSSELRVLPRREPLKRASLHVRRPAILMGAHSVNRAGEGSEFHALREYQSGDALRTVNWKASARSKTLMVNQRVLESQTRLTLLLDARAVAGCGPAKRSPLATGARAALTLAAAAAQGRDRIHFVSYGTDLSEVQPSSAARFLHLLSDHLAALPAAGDMRFDAVARQLLPALRPGNPVGLLSGLEGDAGFGTGIRTLMGRGVTVTLFALPVDASGDEDRATIEAQRQRNLDDVRRAGAHVVELTEGMPIEAVLRLQGAAR